MQPLGDVPVELRPSLGGLERDQPADAAQALGLARRSIHRVGFGDRVSRDLHRAQREGGLPRLVQIGDGLVGQVLVAAPRLVRLVRGALHELGVVTPPGRSEGRRTRREMDLPLRVGLAVDDLPFLEARRPSDQVQQALLPDRLDGGVGLGLGVELAPQALAGAGGGAPPIALLEGLPGNLDLDVAVPDQ